MKIENMKSSPLATAKKEGVTRSGFSRKAIEEIMESAAQAKRGETKPYTKRFSDED